ncbi:hypothetical protein JZO73_13695 [Enterococcus plantarum]|uniref:DUF6674 family protein n=1 Tax=Enterococcus plantarum TaxID=1077675 RepID=UPI001A8DCBD2|nr:DUF6674 family protein [Enterococcus plantarum]MBO0468557.1 hypothetical protein [Enterococcus plantarum]
MEQPLQEDTKIKDFLHVIDDSKIELNVKDLLEIFTFVDSMEKKLNLVSTELQNVKTQLNELNLQIDSSNTMIHRLESRLTLAHSRLKRLKSVIKSNVTKGTLAFKQFGMKGLLKTLDFIQIKRAFQSFQATVTLSITSATKSIDKIDRISQEFDELKKHAKNIAGTIREKEVTPSTSTHSFSSLMKKPFQTNINLLSSIKELTNKSIKKLDNFEQKVATFPKKPSLLGQLKSTQKQAKKDSLSTDKKIESTR